MKQFYLITGANGHLGGTLVRMLQGTDCCVRGLVLPGEQVEDTGNITYFFGDVTKPETLEPLFDTPPGAVVIVIHTAGIVDISEKVTPLLYQVNVVGTKNIIAMCQRHGVKRLVHVSSVHAIPEGDKMGVLTEVQRFSPDTVVGGYAKTKAEATQAVLDAATKGLNAVVVHPSGILGPYDESSNHVVQMVKEYMRGKLPACVRGGYDFVDVRDVAVGCLLAAEHGKAGSCYILSNRHYEIKDILAMVRKTVGGRRLPVLPLWMAKMAAPLLGWWARLKKQRPLYTRYSLYTLGSNDRFSHDKATAELCYQPRDLLLTVGDTVNWLKEKTKQPFRRKRKR